MKSALVCARFSGFCATNILNSHHIVQEYRLFLGRYDDYSANRKHDNFPLSAMTPPLPDTESIDLGRFGVGHSVDDAYAIFARLQIAKGDGNTVIAVLLVTEVLRVLIIA